MVSQLAIAEHERNTLVARQAALVNEAGGLGKLIEKGGDAKRQYDALDAAIAAADVTISQARLDREQAMGEPAIGSGDEPHLFDAVAPVNPEAIRLLRKGDKMADLVRANPRTDIPLGALIKGLVTGDFGGFAKPVAQVGIGSGGASLVSEKVSANIIDLARAAARVTDAGATIIPMDSTSLRVPRLITDGDAQWKPENQALTNLSDLEFDAVTLTPKVVMALAKISVELAEDGVDATGAVERALSAALANAIDLAALRGDGSGVSPTGVLSEATTVTDVTTQLDNFDDFSFAVQAIRQFNLEPNALIGSPDVAGQVDRLKDQNDQPLQPPASYAGLEKFWTNQAGSGRVFIGKWDELLIGMRRDIFIEASRVAADGTDGAFRNLQVWIRAYARVDVACARPDAFAVLENIFEGS